MNTKAKGARAERRARAMLEADGWTVIRAGGSFGPFDLVAVSRRGVRLLQVKCVIAGLGVKNAPPWLRLITCHAARSVSCGYSVIVSAHHKSRYSRDGLRGK